MPIYLTPMGDVFPRFPDRPYVIGFGRYVSTINITGFNVYAGANGIYGLVGTADASAQSFQDVGGAPDFNSPPPAGTNPFAIANADGTTGYSYPGAVCYFQQRLIFGRSDAFPNSFWGSAIGNFSDFDQPDFVTDSDSCQFLIAATKLEEIRSIVPQRELLIFTSSSETVASGSNGGVGGAITPTSIDVRPASHHGSSYLDPVVADHSVLSVTGKGCFIRDLQYDFRSASYTGRDITSLVRHLLDGHTIVDWFFAETPDSIIWIIRDDGVALSLTYEQDFEVVAFAQHTSNQAILGALPGLFQRVCSVPEGTEDAVYFVVQRTINGTPMNNIERLSSRFIDGPNGPQDYRQCCFLDCAFSYDGRNQQPSVGLGVEIDVPIAGQFGVIATSGANPFTENDATLNNIIVLNPDGVPQPGVDDQPGTPLPPVRLRIVTYVAPSNVVCELDSPAPASWDPFFSFTTDWAIARKTFTGLNALNGCAVGALVDGQADLGTTANVVVNGSITITKPGVDVTIGLPYFSDLQTLDTASDGYKVNQRQVQQASTEVVNSRAFAVGEDFNHLNALKPRKVTDGYGMSPLLNGLQALSMANSWNTSGAICLRMKDPLPLTIVSIMREIAVGGRG